MSDPSPEAAGLDPRLADLARVLGRALARRRLQEHRSKDAAPDTSPPPLSTADDGEERR